MEDDGGTPSDRVPTPPLPPGTTPLTNQISGHFYGQQKTKLGILEMSDGSLVKPLIPSKGDNELVFYRSVFHPSPPEDIVGLQPLVPAYLGLWRTPLHPDIDYLKLENITKKFNKPCILDVKIGQRCYEPTASEEKIRHEIDKYPPQEVVGFRMQGMKVYNPETDEYFKSAPHKSYRKLQATDIFAKAILPYLHLRVDPAYKQHVIRSMITRLQCILAWFHVQKTYHFYASSLLLVYEGKPGKGNPDHPIDIRLVDFTHVFPANGKLDTNSTYGIRTLLEHFKNALSECS